MRRIGPAALALVLLSSCSLTAELEITEVSVTLPRQSVPAFDAGNPAVWCNPSGPPPPVPCVGLSTAYDLGAQVPALAQKNVSYELRLTDVAFTLSATQPSGTAPTDLSGVKSALIRVGTDPLTPGSGIVIASYVRPGSAPAAPITTLVVSGAANVDLAPYVRSGTLPIRVEVVIDQGTSAFDADIHATFYVKVTLDWGKYL